MHSTIPVASVETETKEEGIAEIDEILLREDFDEFSLLILAWSQQEYVSRIN